MAHTVDGIALVEACTGFVGERGHLRIELQRYYSRYHGGDDKPEGDAGDRWIGKVWFRLSGGSSGPWWSRVHDARCYGVDKALASIESFLAHARAALVRP